MHTIEVRLHQLGCVLPEPPKPVASYLPAVRSGNWIVVSGQLPFQNGQLLYTGCVPAPVRVEQAQAAAARCVLNALAIVRAELQGDWARLVRVVRVGVFVQSANGYDGQPQVANGASDLLVQILGESGRHARAAVGTNSLPLNSPVEVELTVEVH